MNSLGDLLVKASVISPAQLFAANRHRKENGGEPLARSLVTLGFVSEDQILDHLRRWFPVVESGALRPEPEALRRVPLSFAERHTLLPLTFDGSTLTVAMADPYNQTAINELRFLTGCNVKVVLSASTSVRTALQRTYSNRSTEKWEELSKLGNDSLEVVDTDEGEIDVKALQRATEEAPLVKLVSSLLTLAIQMRASDVHVEPYRERLRVRFRIDGVLQDVLNPPLAIRSALASRLKIMATLDIAQRRMPQDGTFRLRLPEGREVNLRVSVLPTIFGEKIVLRILEQTNLAVDVTRLGFDERDLGCFRRAITRPHGMVIVTGPTGSGKTTTLYSAIGALNDIARNISTAEDPVELDLAGVNQVQVNEEIGLTFSAVLRSLLRQDPDVIMVGEIRDVHTVEIAVRAALTGHLVLSTLHTNDAPSSIVRLLEMGVEPPLVASCLNLIVAQRLVRLICRDCKAPVEYPREVMLEAGFSEAEAGTLVLSRGKGCGECGETGYRGRAPLFEVMAVNEAIRRLALGSASSTEIRALAISQGMRTLYESGLARVRAGETTLEEALRVTGIDD